VCETSGSSILIHGNSNLLDASAALEELFNGPLLSSEAEVANEDGGCFSSIGTTCSTLGLVSASSLAAELNPDSSAVQIFLIGGVEGLSCGCMVAEFNEGLALGSATSHEELDLGELTVLAEELVEAILCGVERETLNEEFGLAVVLVGDSSGLSSRAVVGLISIGAG